MNLLSNGLSNNIFSQSSSSELPGNLRSYVQNRVDFRIPRPQPQPNFPERCTELTVIRPCDDPPPRPIPQPLPSTPNSNSSPSKLLSNRSQDFTTLIEAGKRLRPVNTTARLNVKDELLNSPLFRQKVALYRSCA